MRNRFKQILNELVHLEYEYRDQGKEFINKLFNKFVTVTVKVDFAALAVENTGRKITYWGREGKKEITPVIRKSFDYYEDAIAYLETKNLTKIIPPGWKIYFEMANNYNFGAMGNMVIAYPKRPKNNLVLNYATDGSGKRIVPSDPKVLKIAKDLDVHPPVVLFAGKLNGAQKKKILDFFNMNEDERRDKLGHENFTNYFVSLFNSKFSGMMGTRIMEGLVFYFNNDENDVYMAKVIDPMFKIEHTLSGDDPRTVKLRELENRKRGWFKQMVGWINKNRGKIKVLIRKVQIPDNIVDYDDKFLYIMDETAYQLWLRNLKQKMEKEFEGYVDEEKNFRNFNWKEFTNPQLISELKKNDVLKLFYRVFSVVYYQEHKRGSGKIGDKESVAKINDLAKFIKQHIEKRLK